MDKKVANGVGVNTNAENISGEHDELLESD